MVGAKDKKVSDATRIAIVEDDDSFQLALVELLGSFGYNAKGFVSAEAFLADDPGWFDCLITDLNLPGISGLELCRMMTRRTPRLPVIVITAVPDPQLDNAVTVAGAVCLLRKPIDADDLIARLKQTVGS